MLETLLSYILYAVRDLNVSEVLAVAERARLDSPQRGGNPHVLDCGQLERARAKLFQSLIQVDGLQLVATLKRIRAHLLRAGREDELLQTASVEAVCTESLERVRELDSFQASAVAEGVLLDVF